MVPGLPSTSSPTPPTDARWYAVHALPRAEERAARELAAQGFAAFLPRIVRTVRHARRMHTRTVPLFPRYLFVRLDPARERWRAVNGTFGVARIVAAGERPQPVPPGIVEAIRAACDPSGVLAPQGALRAGQKVRLLAGPFAERIGELHRIDGTGRVRVLLELLGGTVPVHVPESALMPAA